MNTTAQLDGLNRLLKTITAGESSLDSLLDELGFAEEQAQWLRDERRPQMAAGLVEALRTRLAAGEKDLWFRLLCRRFGLDGQPALPLEQAASALKIDADYASQAQAAALEKCRTQGVLDGLRTDLRRIVLDELKQAGRVPGKDEIAGKLRRLADLHSALDMARMNYDARRNELLKMVQAELDALETEFAPRLEAAEQNAETLANEIKNDVLLGGQSVSTELYQAVYNRGRVTWDTQGINEYAESHPEVLEFRRVGAPSVALRQVGKD